MLASRCRTCVWRASIRRTIFSLCAAQCRDRQVHMWSWRSQGDREKTMATVDVKNLNNEVVGTLDLSDDVFNGPINKGLMHQAVKQYLASQRLGTHKTKTRAEVSGSGRKPWRQKGTGRARVGEIRNPLWRKGGTVFGPQPRSYDYQLPKKVEKGALRAALTQKLRVDVKPEDKLALSVRNIAGVRLVPSNRVSARDVVNTRRVG